MTVDEFDFPGDYDQRIEIARVHNRIASIIASFFHDHGIGYQFRGDELRRYVVERYPAAPDSAGRIMRDMRERKWINYEVVNRRASLYRIIERKDA